MQQHIAPGSNVLGLGVFNLVVTDAVLAGNKDHAAGRQLGHVHRVMAGARDGGHVGVTQLFGRAGHRVNAVVVEVVLRTVPRLVTLVVSLLLLIVA